MEPRPWQRFYDAGVPDAVEVPDLRLDEVLELTAQRFPERPAVVFFGRSISYRELNELVDRLTVGLQDLGMEPGDRVAVFMPNCPQTVMTYLAVWRAGGVVVPSNPLYTAAEFGHQAADSGARIAVCLTLMYERVAEARPGTSLERIVVTGIKEYFTGPMRALFTLVRERREGHRIDHAGDPGVHDLQDVLAGGEGRVPKAALGEPEDTAVLMYTGGTTGVPRGARLSHRNLLANAAQVTAWAPGLEDGREIVLVALPLSHAYALTVGLNQSILRGFSQVIVPDARDLVGLLKVIHSQRPTIFPGVPALYAALANHREVKAGKHDLTSIRYCISGAAGLPPDTQRRFQEISGSSLVEGYGLSEAGPVTHCNPLVGGGKIGTIGVPLPGTDARIVDEETESLVVGVGERGVLCVAGPQVMAGYWNDPDASAAALVPDGLGRTWLHTGDVAMMDDDGFFRIVDRKKDLILAAGGLNVYPREIEDALMEHPAVAEAGVIGVPVGGADQRVKAFVALREGEQVTAEELIAFCRARLARYKVPRTIEFRGELPRSFVGKVLRRRLMEEEQGG